MKLSALVDLLEHIAPTRLAEAWDNVGLLVGDPAQTVTGIMLCIDYTASVAAEAKVAACNLIVAYHPPIFQPIKRLSPSSLIFDAISRGIAIYSPHTALDVADGGTNDMLADAIGMIDRGPLRAATAKATQYKLVVFVPEADLDRVSQALFAAGAGRIGRYSSCSFRSPGTGTFLGGEGSNPTIGQSGRLEETPEIRLETIIPIDKVDPILRALRQAHSYEEPAFDLIPLAAPPEVLGLGRLGSIAPTTRPAVFDRIRRELDLPHLLIAGPTEGPASRAAVCAGSCGDLLTDAITARADIYLTGELRHHDAVRAAAEGLTVICTLHSNSERAVLKRLKPRLTTAAIGLPIHLSTTDRDPFSIH
jgi:dinuclear metal center YbgI/SA1388 family protein